MPNVTAQAEADPPTLALFWAVRQESESEPVVHSVK